MYDAPAIADRIRERAKSNDVSVSEMLIACGMNKDSLTSMNAGSVPKADRLAKIADYLGTSTDYLLGRTDDPTPPPKPSPVEPTEADVQELEEFSLLAAHYEGNDPDIGEKIRKLATELLKKYGDN